MSSTAETKYVYFWSEKEPEYGCFSQWYRSDFEEDGVRFNCSEQYMMAKKALLFGDQKIYEKIMKTTSPKQMKFLGRKVQNFDPVIWEKERYDIVLCGNMLKFGYNTNILDILRNTSESIIAEASPYDKIWGIGLRKRKGLTKKNWQGLNLLGEVLMEVRKTL